jgi:nucleoside-diphosphate-sugar epimerase
MRALVTGGAGFIGHHLVLALLARGDDVVVLDDLHTGRIERLAPVLDRIAFHHGDVRDAADVERAMRACAVVFHLAALPSIARSLDDPVASISVNVDGTVRVMEAAARLGVERVVFAGSSSIYGASPLLPRREDQPPEPRSPYAAAKLAAEHIVHGVGSVGGVTTVVLRYFNVYGPGQDPRSRYAAIVPVVIDSALRGGIVEIHGDGQQSRDFTYVDDVVAATLAAATPGVPAGSTCNIGGGASHSVLDLVALVESALGVRIDTVQRDPRPGDVRHSRADVSLAAELLGYRPATGFQAGIRRTIAWYRDALGDDPAALAPAARLVAGSLDA